MVLYRDEHLIVLDKPQGLPTQGGPGIRRHLDGMLAALRDGQGERPRLVHRLDRETAGVLVVARLPGIAAKLAAAFRSRTVEKIYWAVVAGRPVPVEGRIESELVRVDGFRGERAALAGPYDTETAHAITDYRTLDHAARKLAWLELRPLTGRTHQLRVQCAAIGAPILGDPAIRHGTRRPQHGAGRWSRRDSASAGAPHRPAASGRRHARGRGETARPHSRDLRNTRLHGAGGSKTGATAVRWVVRCLVLLLALAVLAGVGAVVAPGLLKTRVEAAASRALGREVTIADLSLRPAWPPTLVASGVRADGLGTLARAEASLAPGSLLDGAPRVATLRLVRPDIVAGANLDGPPPAHRHGQSSQPAAPAPEEPRVPLVGHVTVEDGRLAFADPRTGRLLAASVSGTLDMAARAFSLRLDAPAQGGYPAATIALHGAVGQPNSCGCRLRSARKAGAAQHRCRSHGRPDAPPAHAPHGRGGGAGDHAVGRRNGRASGLRSRGGGARAGRGGSRGPARLAGRCIRADGAERAGCRRSRACCAARPDALDAAGRSCRRRPGDARPAPEPDRHAGLEAPRPRRGADGAAPQAGGLRRTVRHDRERRLRADDDHPGPEAAFRGAGPRRRGPASDGGHAALRRRGLLQSLRSSDAARRAPDARSVQCGAAGRRAPASRSALWTAAPRRRPPHWCCTPLRWRWHRC